MPHRLLLSALWGLAGLAISSPCWAQSIDPAPPAVPVESVPPPATEPGAQPAAATPPAVATQPAAGAQPAAATPPALGPQPTPLVSVTVFGDELPVHLYRVGASPHASGAAQPICTTPCNVALEPRGRYFATARGWRDSPTFALPPSTSSVAVLIRMRGVEWRRTGTVLLCIGLPVLIAGSIGLGVGESEGNWSALLGYMFGIPAVVGGGAMTLAAVPYLAIPRQLRVELTDR